MLRIGAFGRVLGIWQKFAGMRMNRRARNIATRDFAVRDVERGLQKAASIRIPANFCHQMHFGQRAPLALAPVEEVASC